MKFSIQTYGCQMNVADTERMARLLVSAGHTEADRLNEAEIVLLNTCSIRDTADRRAYGRIGELKRFKDFGNLRILGICGCLAQSDGESLVSRWPHVDFAVGTRAFHEIPSLISRSLGGDTHHVRTEMTTRPTELWDREEMIPLLDHEPQYPAFVSIMRGCNKNCTFCIVPNVRGREEYRPPEGILREVRQRIDAGYREVTLVGQNVNCYKSGDVDFAGLLRQTAALPGLRRLRFATNHPRHFNNDIIDAMAESPIICEHAHLPVQSGSNRILKRMARSYDRERYLSIIDTLREKLPGASITTDLIVGFPGETDAEFEETLELCRQVRWDAAFMFTYSPRRGTRAADMEDQIPEPVKTERLHRLIELQDSISQKLNNNYLGQTVEVMVERAGNNPSSNGASPEEPGANAPMPSAGLGVLVHEPAKVQSRTRTHKVVIFDGHDFRPGDFVDIHITEARPSTLFGHAVTKSRAPQTAGR